MAVGKKTGGRTKGAKNKATLLKEEMISERVKAAQEAGLTPLEFMLAVLRDPANPMADRYVAARDAAPYMHPRLTSSTVKVDAKHTIADLDTAEIIAAIHAESAVDGTAAAEDGDREPDSLH
jgi:hypothetical protein